MDKGIGFYVDQVKALEERVRALEMDLDLANKVGAHHRKVAQLRGELTDELRKDVAALKNQLRAREQIDQVSDFPKPGTLTWCGREAYRRLKEELQAIARDQEAEPKFLRGELP